MLKSETIKTAITAWIVCLFSHVIIPLLIIFPIYNWVVSDTHGHNHSHHIECCNDHCEHLHHHRHHHECHDEHCEYPSHHHECSHGQHVQIGPFSIHAHTGGALLFDLLVLIIMVAPVSLAVSFVHAKLKRKPSCCGHSEPPKHCDNCPHNPNK